MGMRKMGPPHRPIQQLDDRIAADQPHSPSHKRCPPAATTRHPTRPGLATWRPCTSPPPETHACPRFPSSRPPPFLSLSVLPIPPHVPSRRDHREQRGYAGDFESSSCGRTGRPSVCPRDGQRWRRPPSCAAIYSARDQREQENRGADGVGDDHGRRRA